MENISKEIYKDCNKTYAINKFEGIRIEFLAQHHMEVNIMRPVFSRLGVNLISPIDRGLGISTSPYSEIF